MTRLDTETKQDLIIDKLVDIIDKQHSLIKAMAETVEKMVATGTDNPVLGARAVASMKRAVAASTQLVTDIKTIWQGPES